VSHTLLDTPAAPKLPPRERVAKWEPLLRDHGWTVHVTHTDQRARLEATHPSGAVLMVTSGMAGRTMKGTTKLYVLQSDDRPAIWFGVRKAGLEEFIKTRILKGYKARVHSKCRCRTGSGRAKVRYLTEDRARKAIAEARQQRAREGQEATAECRAYRCPDDDRVWHASSRPVWRDAPGDSRLWG
jgi:hypothetical protein